MAAWTQRAGTITPVNNKVVNRIEVGVREGVIVGDRVGGGIVGNGVAVFVGVRVKTVVGEGVWIPVGIADISEAGWAATGMQALRIKANSPLTKQAR